MTHTTATNTYHVFMLPDLEAYVHGLKFKNKLKRWGKSQGFKELSPDNLKEWCTDSFVLDSLLKVNNYKTSPLNSPISPMTPEFPHALWQLPVPSPPTPPLFYGNPGNSGNPRFPEFPGLPGPPATQISQNKALLAQDDRPEKRRNPLPDFPFPG
ncbi:hypothetical protein C6P43_004610 [Kluyveromyces marxianus]|nr:hypothetical protein C6P43_004610 [Kluyveromyces marxianus]